MTHWAVPRSTLKSPSIALRATFSAVKSFAITITPRPIATRAITAPGAMRSGSTVCVAAGATPAFFTRECRCSAALACACWDPPNGTRGLYPGGRWIPPRSEPGEKPRVVGADAVDGHRRQRAHPWQVVDRPGDQLQVLVVALLGQPPGHHGVVR